MVYTVREKYPKADRPRERLIAYGPQALADHELLAVILRTGTKKENVIDSALNILTKFQNLYNLKQASLEELLALDGIGPTKAASILAACELGYRIQQSRQIKMGRVVSSQGIGERLLEEMHGLEQEHVLALYLNTKNEIIKESYLFVGSLSQSVAHPREIFKEAVRCSAARLILAHNHPSGDPEPSQADYQFTRRIAECGEMMGIELLDHFVIGHDAYVSLKERGSF